MTKLTHKETRLIQRYMTGSKQGLVVAMRAALPFVDEASQNFFASTLAKVEKMTEVEFYNGLTS